MLDSRAVVTFTCSEEERNSHRTHDIMTDFSFIGWTIPSVFLFMRMRCVSDEEALFRFIWYSMSTSLHPKTSELKRKNGNCLPNINCMNVPVRSACLHPKAWMTRNHKKVLNQDHNFHFQLISQFMAHFHMKCLGIGAHHHLLAVFKLIVQSASWFLG